MKYTVKDFNKLVEIFYNLSQKSSMSEVTVDDIKGLLDYPINVIQEFMNAVKSIKETDEEKIKDQLYGIKAYVLIRMNLVDMMENQNTDI